jgi:transposase InsO family protein
MWGQVAPESEWLRVITEDWRLDDNAERSHSAHGDLTPTEFERRHHNSTAAA